MKPAIEPGAHPDRLLALVTCACMTGGIATAQQAEVASPTSCGPGRAVPTVAASAGSAKALLYDNGPYVTNTGIGCGGADVSEVEPGLTVDGYLHEQQSGTRIADDFVLPASDCSWVIDEVKWLAFQTAAPTAGSINGITINLYDASPSGGGSSIAGDDTTDRLVSTVWTGVYRVYTIAPPDCLRAVIEVTGDMSFAGKLPSEDYWLSVACDGSPSLPGPLANPTVPWDSSDNGEQRVGGVWAPLTGGQGGGGVDFPFRLMGTVSGDPIIYCTAQPSSLPGCVPSVGAPSCAASIGAGPGSFDITCGPVPGGGMPGIFIHTPHGARNPPSQGPYGYLCIASPFWRGGLSLPGGSTGTCNGMYVFDFGTYMQQHAPNRGLVPGNTCDVQVWYRDPGSPSTANLSNAMAFVLVP